jgi:hypothetical protein
MFEVVSTAHAERCSVVPAVSGLPVVSGRGHSLSPSWAADDVLMQDVPAADSVLLAVRHTDRRFRSCA